MTNHRSSGSRRHTRNESKATDKKLHKDWRLWLIIGIMLTAMFTYVLTLDDSVVPLFMRQ
jgi:nicotinamide riboside transporter PnuC